MECLYHVLQGFSGLVLFSLGSLLVQETFIFPAMPERSLVLRPVFI